MRRYGLHNLRYRKNQGTSCLIMVLFLVLIIMLFAFWKLNADNLTPKYKPQLTPGKEKPTTSKVETTPLPQSPKPDSLIKPNPDAKPNRQARMLNKGDYLLVEKSLHTLKHYRGGQLITTYPVALGKNPGDKTKEGDNATPEGHFEINFIKDSSSWTHDFGDGKGQIKGAYGPFFMALYTGAQRTFSGKTWRGIGIHGTHDPTSINTNASEGCIRLHNSDLIKLKNSIEGKTLVQVDIIK